MENINRADNFYRDLMVRRHFCVWIEKYIEMLKLKKTASVDDLVKG